MQRIEKEYDRLLRDLASLSYVQVESRMRSIHILSAKYKAICTE